MNDSPLPIATRQVIQKRFQRAYGGLVSGFAGGAIAIVAWYWSLPKDDATGLAWGEAAFLLLGAAALVNGLSFFIQNRFVRNQLKRPEITAQFSVWRFALRFYAYNLAVAIALSVFGFYPLIAVVFFYAYYPILFWLLPYHLPLGLILGWLMQRQLASYR